MSFYSKIKAVQNAVNSERLSDTAEADLFRDGLYVGKFEIPGSPESLPVIVPIELFGSLCVIDDGSHQQQIVDFMQACAFRILSSVDSTLCNFILYDGVSLGRGLISLSELDSRIKGDKILTTSNELSRALEKLSDRVVTVIQNILGSKYANSSLMEYNKTAGNATEPYYFLFLKDYPAGLNDEQCRLIEKLVQSGPQAGIFTFISYSTEHYADTSYNGKAKNILKHTANIVHYKDDTFLWHNIPNQEIYNYFPFRLATILPNPTLLKSLFEKVTERLNRAENIKVDIIS